MEEYNKWSASCYAIFAEEIQAAIDQAAADALAAAEDGTSEEETCDFWCQTFGTIGLFRKPQKLQGEMITKEAREACKTYGHTGETNFYNLGLFVGDIAAKIFATEVVS